jgi:hypothetical protein
MAHYWKKCPYCGNTTEDGYGIPLKRLGNPHRQCRFCSNIYKDRSVIDWETASLIKKALFYLGNGRLLCTLFVTVFFEAFLRNCTDLNPLSTTAITITTFISILGLCFLYVWRQVKEYQTDNNFDATDTVNHYEKYKNDPFAINQSTKKK